MYDRIWANISQLNEGNYIRPGRTIVFRGIFVLFRLTKIIDVDADGLFPGVFNKTIHEALLIPAHAATSVNTRLLAIKGFVGT